MNRFAALVIQKLAAAWTRIVLLHWFIRLIASAKMGRINPTRAQRVPSLLAVFWHTAQPFQCIADPGKTRISLRLAPHDCSPGLVVQKRAYLWLHAEY